MKEITVTFPEAQFHTLGNLLQLICVAGLEFHGQGNAIPTKDALKEIWDTMLRAQFGKKEDPIEMIRRKRWDAEGRDRDRVEGISILRMWLRGIHMQLVIGPPHSYQDMTQDEIAERLGENPRGHSREFLIPDPEPRTA
jgi:hypothetical protein